MGEMIRVLGIVSFKMFHIAFRKTEVVKYSPDLPSSL